MIVGAVVPMRKESVSPDAPGFDPHAPIAPLCPALIDVDDCMSLWATVLKQLIADAQIEAPKRGSEAARNKAEAVAWFTSPHSFDDLRTVVVLAGLDADSVSRVRAYALGRCAHG